MFWIVKNDDAYAKAPFAPGIHTPSGNKFRHCAHTQLTHPITNKKNTNHVTS